MALWVSLGSWRSPDGGGSASALINISNLFRLSVKDGCSPANVSEEKGHSYSSC